MGMTAMREKRQGIVTRRGVPKERTNAKRGKLVWSIVPVMRRLEDIGSALLDTKGPSSLPSWENACEEMPYWVKCRWPCSLRIRKRSYPIKRTSELNRKAYDAAVRYLEDHVVSLGNNDEEATMGSLQRWYMVVGKELCEEVDRTIEEVVRTGSQVIGKARGFFEVEVAESCDNVGMYTDGDDAADDSRNDGAGEGLSPSDRSNNLDEPAYNNGGGNYIEAFASAEVDDDDDERYNTAGASRKEEEPNACIEI